MKDKLKFEDIQDDFEIYGIQVVLTDEVKRKCLSLCETHNLSSEQIAVNWLSFAASNSYEEVTFDRLDSFEKDIIKEKKSRTKVDVSILPEEELPTSTKKPIYTADDDLLAAYGASPAPAKNATSTDSPRQPNAKRSFAFSQSLEELKSTPLAPSLSQSPSTQQSQRYSLRTNSGALVTSFGPNADTTKWEANFEYSPQIKLVECGGDSPLTSSYKFMFEKLRDCADVLDDTIFHLGNQILKSKDIEETVNLRTTSNDAIWCVGRICCDSLGKLNAASVLLEGDRETCSGATVKLDLSRLGHYALFPGQIVAVKGINSTGECLVAEEIVIGKILESPKCSNLNNDGLQIRIACGPFTTLENLLYEPLMDLLKDVVEKPPHVLFLLGPMLDSSHPSLEDPLLSDSYDSILARCFDKIDSALVNTDVKVYVVTSLRDVCCSSIYPTPPVLLSGQMTVGSKIQLLSDPSLLDIGGLHIGLTTIDFPMQMSREEISYFPQGSDRLGRLARHMLLQQSFYPIYPPPEGICLNIEQADIHARLPFTPHIMITPSDLKGYVKDVEGCLFVNPERLTKGKTGGCHCKLEVKPSTQQQRPEINVKICKI